MSRLTLMVPIGLFGMWTVVIGLSGPASGQVVLDPPVAGPLEGIQIQLGNIQSDIGNLQDTVDELEPKLPKPQGPCEIPPVWGKKWPDEERFVQVLDGGAYCDRETGLVWTRVSLPIKDEGPPLPESWYGALNKCRLRVVDNRAGWHLPLVEQLLTLFDYSKENQATALNTPNGPFLNVSEIGFYWTAEVDPIHWTENPR